MADLNKYIEQLQNFDVNDIDWERIGVWPLPARIFVCLLACGAILFACHFFIVKDKNTVLEAAKSKETQLRRSFESKAYEAANLDRYRQQMEEMSGTLNVLVSRLPSNIEVPGLLEDIDDKAVEARLDIEGIKPEKEIQTEFHIELPIKINVTGGYHEFGAFVSGIAGMPRIVTLHDFSIKRDRDQGSSLNMEIIAKTYRYKSQEE
ncbi:type 4a pilus biogenesis protein PilO [Agarilytica rhodophyticola]|uniref:type 4a pilus biogenesis protein PilO n=1 Tax=Agarilytica rhodophyticola TaxID=1737490 RepID=UPI000B345DD4|nr:type 4a pilus biogenesis protein PilO [Agarilytica rhodophyticola]